MATTQLKRIGRRPQNKGTYLTRENWEVMKPFVIFGAQALAAIGSVAWGIIKLAPRLLEHGAKNDSSSRSREIVRK